LNFRFPLISLFLLIVLSCSAPSNDNETQHILSEGVKWQISSSEIEHYYTDLISLTITGELSSFDEELMAKGKLWGDFRIYGYKRTSLQSLTITLQPLKTGAANLQIPRDLPFSSEIEFSILSNLNKGESELKPLIPDDRMIPLWIIIILSFIITSLCTGLFIYVKRKKENSHIQQTQTQTLEQFLEQNPSDLNDPVSCINFYKKAYVLLLHEICEKHPSVKASDSPAELKAHLEEPSSLNQWALRSLYPFLEELESIFFTPLNPHQKVENLNRNLNILREWLKAGIFEDGNENK
jgi:hypothetical protein